ncbi:MAG: DUF3501 family protein [Steroidobacteraceae bacterium]
MPQKLTRADLMSLEQYAVARETFRAQVLEHKRSRSIAIGPHASWSFEDRRTVQYQVQEMLRIERIFEAAGIDEELAAYNPLVPNGSNWMATFLIEFPDEQQRRVQLAVLKGIEHRCWMQVEGEARVWAIADEDLERENEEKTSAVHFLRFELTPAMRASVKAGAAIGAGIDHDAYRHEVHPLPAQQRDSLAWDLD